MQGLYPFGQRVHQPRPRLGDYDDLRRLLDLPLPAVDGADAGEDVGTGGEAFFDEGAGDFLRLRRVGAGDVDEAEVCVGD
jgi:hypothetical protein